LQSQVAGAIASEIRVKLTPQQQAALRSPRAINPDAYDDYLRALTQSETVDGLRLSIAYFEQALRKQPDYAEAHVELGDTYVLLTELLNLPAREAFPHAKAEALKALQFDESLAEAHELLGAVNFLYDWDFLAAEKKFQRAIALNPNSVDPGSYQAHISLGVGGAG
jgi:tetratricopeptide (TPR) repeat protein